MVHFPSDKNIEVEIVAAVFIESSKENSQVDLEEKASDHIMGCPQLDQ